jgi:hypothetical protein
VIRNLEDMAFRLYGHVERIERTLPNGRGTLVTIRERTKYGKPASKRKSRTEASMEHQDFDKEITVKLKMFEP